jgi:hypothetical protein
MAGERAPESEVLERLGDAASCAIGAALIAMSEPEAETDHRAQQGSPDYPAAFDMAELLDCLGHCLKRRHTEKHRTLCDVFVLQPTPNHVSFEKGLSIFDEPHLVGLDCVFDPHGIAPELERIFPVPAVHQQNMLRRIALDLLWIVPVGEATRPTQRPARYAASQIPATA